MNKTDSLTIPDMITVSNAALGFLAITYIIDDRLWLASMLIIICVVLDGLDGFLARLLGVEHDLGAYLDFFSDIISFCFAPALLLYHTYYDETLGRGWESPQNFLATLIPFMIVFLGTLRLARFVDKRSEESVFYGLPTPALALVVIHLTYLFGWGGLDWYHPFPVLFFIGFLGTLLFTKIEYPKPRNKYYIIGGILFLTVALFGLLSEPISHDYCKTILSITTSLLLGYVFISPIIVKFHGKGQG